MKFEINIFVSGLSRRDEESLKLELRAVYLYSDTRFEDVFKCAKRAFSVLEHSKNSFEVGFFVCRCSLNFYASRRSEWNDGIKNSICGNVSTR